MDNPNKHSDSEYLRKCLLKWTKEEAEILAGKPLQNSWILQVGFKLTPLGHKIFKWVIDETITKGKVPELNEIELGVVYIGEHNIKGHAPTFAHISTDGCKEDYTATLALMTGLVMMAAVKFT